MFNSVVDTIFAGATWFMGIALAASLVAVLLPPLLMRLDRKRQQRKEAEGQRRGDEHYRRQLQAAADHAITTAVRARLAEPITDLHIVHPLRITTGDVIARALEDFVLRVPRADAAAMLRHRLECRGHARWPDLITDAYEHQEDQP
ncbi:hypothetical protein ACFY12_34120 [Streptomyces sp. NPDC001339]|uniref:hypothetical protein n=1 Tax=Streptomyces sp. NPDC001339 TaxID=3364563 RepID=UPI00367F7F3F